MLLEMIEYSLECLAMYNFNICYFNASTPSIQVLSHIHYLCLKQLKCDFTKGIMHLCHENKIVKQGRGFQVKQSYKDIIELINNKNGQNHTCLTTKVNIG